MTIEALLRGFLMYGVVPIWLVAGAADYACHRASRIEATSGVKESVLHVVQFALVGLPLIGVLVLEVNAAIVLAMLVGLVLHQAVAIWDVRYANDTRRVAPLEQHVHAVLEMNPAFATVIVAILHWPQAIALLGVGTPRFAIEWKHEPLPAGYLIAVFLAVVVLGVLPYGEELARTLRGRSDAVQKTDLR
jgi:hypothetical protein